MVDPANVNPLPNGLERGVASGSFAGGGPPADALDPKENPEKGDDVGLGASTVEEEPKEKPLDGAGVDPAAGAVGLLNENPEKGVEAGVVD